MSGEEEGKEDLTGKLGRLSLSPSDPNTSLDKIKQEWDKSMVTIAKSKEARAAKEAEEVRIQKEEGGLEDYHQIYKNLNLNPELPLSEALQKQGLGLTSELGDDRERVLTQHAIIKAYRPGVDLIPPEGEFNPRSKESIQESARKEVGRLASAPSKESSSQQNTPRRSKR